MAVKSHNRESPASSASDERLTSPLDALLGYRLRRASMVLMGEVVRVLQPFGLSAVEASLLILVGANPGCRQSDVGRALEIKRANLTPLIGRLKARDLITDAPIDGRSLSLTLTDKGRLLQEQALARITASDRATRKRLSMDEASLLATLREIVG